MGLCAHARTHAHMHTHTHNVMDKSNAKKLNNVCLVYTFMCFTVPKGWLKKSSYIVSLKSI